jgi:hypothetical protein
MPSTVSSASRRPFGRYNSAEAQAYALDCFKDATDRGFFEDYD